MAGNDKNNGDASSFSDLLAKGSRLHVIGIGGAGMSAIASVLSGLGVIVTGSDLKESASTTRLAALGVEVFIGHDQRHLDGADAVAVSSAIGEHNVELAAARARGVPVMRRAEVLREIVAKKRTIAVSGTHGKTTTSSMLSLMLVEAGRHPSFLIGGDINEIGTNAVWDSGDLLVVEADESDGTFLELPAEIAVTTNVEADHLDFYGSVDALRQAFSRFAHGAKGAVVFGDDEVARQLGPMHAVSFGFSEGCTYVISEFAGKRAGSSFRVTRRGEDLGRFELPVPGELNALNATAALAGAELAGIEIEPVRRALQRFAGVARRFEFRGERNGITFVDDYAHLPGEVKATLRAASEGGFRRIVAVFQPHRFSRVEALASSFADAFVAADHVVITGIYPAGEEPRPGVSAKLVVDAVLGAHPGAKVTYLPQRADLVSFLKAALHPGDLCLTLSAGDLTSLPEELLAALSGGQ